MDFLLFFTRTKSVHGNELFEPHHVPLMVHVHVKDVRLVGSQDSDMETAMDGYIMALWATCATLIYNMPSSFPEPIIAFPVFPRSAFEYTNPCRQHSQYWENPHDFFHENMSGPTDTSATADTLTDVADYRDVRKHPFSPNVVYVIFLDLSLCSFSSFSILFTLVPYVSSMTPSIKHLGKQYT